MPLMALMPEMMPAWSSLRSQRRRPSPRLRKKELLQDLFDLGDQSEERSAGRSYLASDIGTDIDGEDAGVCPHNPEEDADAINLLQVKAICVDESGEASYLSGFIGIELFKVWKVFANNEADMIKAAGKGGGVYRTYIAINARDDWIFNEVDEQNIPVPPTYNEAVATPKFRNVGWTKRCSFGS